MKKQSNTTLLFFGDVLKTFGANGELLIKTSADTPEKINIKEPVFITIDGLSVSFYFKSVEHKGTQKLLVVFDDMESELAAGELVGKRIYFEAKSSRKSKPQHYAQSDLGEFIGFVLFDKQLKEVGRITDVFEFPANPCFQLFYNEKEILIPVNEDLIVKVDPIKRIIVIDLPEGLMDVFLD